LRIFTLPFSGTLHLVNNAVPSWRKACRTCLSSLLSKRRGFLNVGGGMKSDIYGRSEEDPPGASIKPKTTGHGALGIVSLVRKAGTGQLFVIEAGRNLYAQL